MGKSTLSEQYRLAKFLLDKRFHTPWDLIKYWGFSGPCLEDCPEVEKVRDQD